MRSFRRLASGVSQAAAARCPDFLLAMALPSKKSLRAAERKRADVARARRRWIREQGFLAPAPLVFIARKHLLPDPLFFRCIFSGRRLRRCPPQVVAVGALLRPTGPALKRAK